jgi:cardiolipin synthase (CMP-forming)
MIVKHLPNLVSLFRLLLICPFLFAFYHQAYSTAFSIFLIAGITDAIDGWLARQFHLQTQLGHIIDPLADKLLVAASFVSLALLQQLPWWLVMLVFLRDFTLFFGATAWYYFIERSFEFTPTLLSKLNTGLQILLVMVCLIKIAFHTLDPDPIPLLIYLTALTTSITYVDYVWTWGRKACLIKNC